MSGEQPVRVDIAGNDRPQWGRVGSIAGICFLIGAFLPTLAGLRLVPEVPGKAAKNAEAEPSAKPKPRHSGPGEPPEDVPVAAVVPNEAKLATSLQATVDKTLVVNCRNAEDKRLPECDHPGFDSVATGRLKALVTCEDVEGASGSLSIGFDLDFKAQKIKRILKGKSSTVDDGVADRLLSCAKREFMSATLKDVAHTHARYLVFYIVTFTPPGLPIGSEDGPEPVVKASGSASITWNSARIRSAPEDGDVKARLLYGTKVFITGRQGDWYRIKYDARGTEGWVHKNALAL